MNAIHVMKDGTIRESIDGTVINIAEFYEVLASIHMKAKSNEKVKP